MINNNIIKEYWIKNISKFKKIVNDIPYHDKGIWYTEAFLFCSICDLLNVDAIIESGVANGQSTEIFANYFNFNISAIDNDNYNIFQKTNTRLEKYNNLNLIKGNSFDIIPDIIQQNNNLKFGVFIDGPKAQGAAGLRQKLLVNKNILCFGFHDYYGSNKNAIGIFDNSFITHELDFINEFRYLDNKVLETEPEQSKYINGPGLCVEVR